MIRLEGVVSNATTYALEGFVLLGISAIVVRIRIHTMEILSYRTSLKHIIL